MRRYPACLQPCHVCRDGEPAPVALRPHVRVAAAACAAVDRVGGARIDDREMIHDAGEYFLGLEALDRHGLRGLFEESRTVDQRAVRIAAVEFRREDLVEALHVAVLNRIDVVGVERRERVVIGLRACGHAGLPVGARFAANIRERGGTRTAPTFRPRPKRWGWRTGRRIANATHDHRDGFALIAWESRLPRRNRVYRDGMVSRSPGV